MHDLTHASFFSGVGGLDLGLERAGWRTVSFSEIDPYASAVLAERWPGIPNLGDIVRLARADQPLRTRRYPESDLRSGGGAERQQRPADWTTASLWSGGFPCQDLSVAGKRAGFAGERSSLAFAFLDLVAVHRPPAILLENVPGLLSSHGGKDFGTLLGRLGQLGYWWAYRILDARHFGVPQRRRRVFIVALNAERGFGADSAAAVLSVGARCGRHPATGHATGEGAAGGAALGSEWPQRTAWTLKVTDEHGAGSPERSDLNLVPIGPPPDPGGVRAPDGLAGRLDDLAPTLRVGPARPQDGGPGDTVPIVASETGKGWWTVDDQASAFCSQGGETPHHAVLARVGPQEDSTRASLDSGEPQVAMPDVLLPLGLDSHRYRCCGNGVVSSVSEWIGLRLAAIA